MIKTYRKFVNTELDQFYKDLYDDNKKLKLIPKFKSELTDFSFKKDIKIEVPKKRFRPTIKKMNKKQNKGIF